MPDDKRSIRSYLLGQLDHGLGIVLAILFWFIVFVIVLVAVAQSEKRWDTVIAALAMVSQAFFAWAVWTLSKNQFAYTRQVAERQHKIDMYEHRKAVVQQLNRATSDLGGAYSLSHSNVEAIRQCHLEIKNLFSDEANDASFHFYEEVEQSHHLYSQAIPEYDFGEDIMVHKDQAKMEASERCFSNALDILTDLQNILNNEMMIR